MNLEKQNGQQILAITKRYFYYGIALLLFFWVVNFVWVYPVIRKRPELEHIQEIRKCLLTINQDVFMSLTGCVSWTILLGIWITVFSTQRTSWGFTGDLLTVTIPKGM
jgi:presenilin enhancer 2